MIIHVGSGLIHFPTEELGATVYGGCNVVSSLIARAPHAGVYTHAGPEIGVASTKATMIKMPNSIWTSPPLLPLMPGANR